MSEQKDTPPVKEGEEKRVFRPATGMLANAIRLNASPELIEKLEYNLLESGELDKGVDRIPLDQLEEEAWKETAQGIHLLNEYLTTGKLPQLEKDDNLKLPRNAILCMLQSNPYSEKAVKQLHAVLGISSEMVKEDIRPLANSRYVVGFSSSSMIETPFGFAIEQTRGCQDEGDLRGIPSVTIKVIPPRSTPQA